MLEEAVRLSRGCHEGSFGILSVWRNTAVMPGKHSLPGSIVGGRGRSHAHIYVNRPDTHTHTSPSTFLSETTHTNKHRARSSWASVAVFLLAGCLCFASRQYRGGDTLCNLWRVPGIYTETEREMEKGVPAVTHTHTHYDIIYWPLQWPVPLLWLFPASLCDFGNRRRTSLFTLH